MKLPAAQREELLNALLDAFTDTGQLDIVVSHLGKSLDLITSDKNRRIATHQLIRWAEAGDEVDKLVVAARKENPKNVLLRLAAESLQLASPTRTADYERIVVPSAGFQDPTTWRETMSFKEHTVCRVEAKHPIKGLIGIGTGFLIGSDLVMTNQHVRCFWEKFCQHEGIILRFGYRKKGSVEVDRGMEYKLRASDWLVASSPCNELDYALLRTEGAPGLEQTGHGNQSPVRGWLKPVDHSFTPKEPLLILQHPKARPLELAIGTVVADVGNSRIQHSANTEDGSSGSPCFTADWALVCLHHWGSQSVNCAVAFAGILKDFANKDILLQDPPSMGGS